MTNKTNNTNNTKLGKSTNPMEFTTKGFKIHGRGHISYKHQIQRVKVKACVTISKDTISYGGYMDPENRPWFHISCWNSYGVEFEIVSDGQEYMGFDPKNWQINNEVVTKRSVKIDKLTTFDKEIIQTAISYYLFDEVDNVNQYALAHS